VKATKKMTPAQLAEMPLLTIEQAAQLLQCSSEHLRRQARAGTLPGLVNVAGIYRIRRSALLGES
jgi:excisionase family DNA binding protein